MPQKNTDGFWFHKEPFCQRFFKELCLSYLFIIWRTFFRHKEPFVKQKGSSDVLHLNKKALLWHRDVPLFLRVFFKISSFEVNRKKKLVQVWNNMREAKWWHIFSLFARTNKIKTVHLKVYYFSKLSHLFKTVLKCPYFALEGLEESTYDSRLKIKSGWSINY